MHKLLARQIKRYRGESALSDTGAPLLRAISDAYQQHEQTVKMLERSLFLTSKELNQRNAALKQQIDSIAQVTTELENSLATLNAVFDATGESILVFDLEGTLLDSNAMGSELLTPNESGAVTWHSFLTHLENPQLIEDIAELLRHSPHEHLFGTLKTIKHRIMEYRSLPLTSEDEIFGRVWCLKDVTEEKRNEALVEFQAFHDALTGLPNRTLLLDRLDHAIANVRREEEALAVLFIDLDNFKKVNDAEGHQAGDGLLCEVVERLKGRLRQSDTLSRQGGDEFIILLESFDKDADVSQLCKQLIETLSPPFTVNSRQYYVSASIGVAMYPQHAQDAEALIRKADMAMYHAKSQGKNAYCVYDECIEKNALALNGLETELRQAINAQAFHLVFQPKVNLTTNTISSVEALSRWTRVDGTDVPPFKFIHLAEQLGIISEIGKQVITKACQQLAEWQACGIHHINISINLSSIEFQDKGVIDHLVASIDKFNVAGNRIIIELTESIFMQDKQRIKDTMSMLSECGITFALDDFGKGYSSFSYLQTLPLNYLKIDKAFLSDVEHSKQSDAITKTIIDIGNNLNMIVVAEGIEDQFMLDYVRAKGVAIGQGFYLYRPMDASKLTQLLLEET